MICQMFQHNISARPTRSATPGFPWIIGFTHSAYVPSRVIVRNFPYYRSAKYENTTGDSLNRLTDFTFTSEWDERWQLAGSNPMIYRRIQRRYGVNPWFHDPPAEVFLFPLHSFIHLGCCKWCYNHRTKSGSNMNRQGLCWSRRIAWYLALLVQESPRIWMHSKLHGWVMRYGEGGSIYYWSVWLHLVC